jgi:hypothetical protein
VECESEIPNSPAAPSWVLKQSRQSWGLLSKYRTFRTNKGSSEMVISTRRDFDSSYGHAPDPVHHHAYAMHRAVHLFDCVPDRLSGEDGGLGHPQACTRAIMGTLLGAVRWFI